MRGTLDPKTAKELGQRAIGGGDARESRGPLPREQTSPRYPMLDPKLVPPEVRSKL